MKNLYAADWSPRIEAAVRAIACVAVACYVAGYCLGAWLHRLNDRLAGRRPPAPPAPPQPHPLALIAADLETLPAATLRQMAGVRSRRYRKAELVAMLVAC